MSDFTFWDIVRNLLTGLQWTLLLSLVAFIGGGIIGLLVMVLRISSKPCCAASRGPTSSCSRAHRC